MYSNVRFLELIAGSETELPSPFKDRNVLGDLQVSHYYQYGLY